ncbi:CDT1-like protein b [Morella rubra]|uniref:CDT1-like protein b n=1 Tax=Morella rubra TaxID=262757 RepID=A0A6A1WL54_9ROSI|nr:CDT1-like protein b [Morella rubra]
MAEAEPTFFLHFFYSKQADLISGDYPTAHCARQRSFLAGNHLDGLTFPAWKNSFYSSADSHCISLLRLASLEKFTQPLGLFHPKKYLLSPLKMKPSEISSIPFRSKKPLLHPTAQNPKSNTPEKSTQPPRRSRNCSFALSINEVRRVAENLHHSDSPDQSGPRPKSTRRLIESRGPSCKSKKPAGSPVHLPENYEILAEFFDSLDSSMRLARLKGSTPTFGNLCPKVECLTDRRFSYSHLAQIKFILRDAIQIRRVLVFDERTSCMKPDLHISINVDAIEIDGKLKSESVNMHLRKIFRAQLADFSKSHPEVDEIPEEMLPEPFGRQKLDTQSSTRKIPITAPNLSLGMPIEVLGKQQLAVASHLPRSFHKCLSKTSLQPLVAVPESPLNNRSSKEETAAPAPAPAPSPEELLFEPASNRKSVACSASPATPCKGGEDGSVDNEIFDILPENLIQSIREKERKAIEERNPAISQAKRRRQMIACLPKLFNKIHFLFQSSSQTVILKEELINKVIASHTDIVDRREVEEQLNLLLELVPEWISRKLASGGDSLFCINKSSSPESIRARLEESK